MVVALKRHVSFTCVHGRVTARGKTVILMKNT